MLGGDEGHRGGDKNTSSELKRASSSNGNDNVYDGIDAPAGSPSGGGSLGWHRSSTNMSMEDVVITDEFGVDELEGEKEDGTTATTNAAAATESNSNTTRGAALGSGISHAPTTQEKAGRGNPAQEQDENSTTMALNVAYESLEQMREFNLQIEFGGGNGKKIDYVGKCVECLREGSRSPPPANDDSGSPSNQHQQKSSPPRRRRFLGNRSRRKSESGGGSSTIAPCLTCGSPTCTHHRSNDLCRENITVCHRCSHLFVPQEVARKLLLTGGTIATDSTNRSRTPTEEKEEEQRKKETLNYILDVYDRCLLVLKYSSQYIDTISTSLSSNVRRNNHVGLGSSATGVVAGITGVAAAATIFTPVGPPLLLASVLFGGTATAAAAGSEAVNYRSEPNRMANKILTLHAVVTSIATLPECIIMEHMKRASFVSQNKNLDDDGAGSSSGGDDAGAGAGGGGGGTMDKIGEATPQRSLHWARATMNGLKPLTVGVLSAISVVTEAREMKRVVQRIRAGNPSEKVKMLHRIKRDINGGEEEEEEVGEGEVEIVVKEDDDVVATAATSTSGGTTTTELLDTSTLQERLMELIGTCG